MLFTQNPPVRNNQANSSVILHHLDGCSVCLFETSYNTSVDGYFYTDETVNNKINYFRENFNTSIYF